MDANPENLLVRALETMRRAAAAYGASSATESVDASELVLEALAWATALELTGDLVSVPEPLAESLRRAGRRVLLAPPQAPAASASGGGEDASPQDAAAEAQAEAIALALPLARDGLRALSGKPRDRIQNRVAPESSAASASSRSGSGAARDNAAGPSAAALVAFARGKLDGLSAASLAMQIRSHPASLRELAWLRRRMEAGSAVRSAPQRWAAAPAEALLDPAEGRLIGRIGPQARAIVEVYAFAPGSIDAADAKDGEGRALDHGPRLAAYAADSLPLHVEADGLVTQTMQPGYWCGTCVGPMPTKLHIRLGDQVNTLEL